MGLEEIRAVVEFLVVFFYIGFVELIVDFAHDFFDDVFHGDESRSAAVFVDDNGDVDLLLAEVLKQVVDLSVFRDKEGWTDELLPFIGFGIQIGQEVFDIKDAFHLIQSLVIDGNS